MNKTLKLTLFLAIVSAIAGAALGFANNVTAPIIAENALKAEKATLKIVALNDDGTIYDYVAISNGDTSGIGTKVTEENFRNTLKDKDATSDALLNDTITGATVSSKPVLQGIMEAAQYQAENLK